MKGIVTNLLQNGKWTIPDWSQLLPFSLHPVLDDVKPNFITHLELVVDSVFVISSLVMGLTFLQLFLYCLVD